MDSATLRWLLAQVLLVPDANRYSYSPYRDAHTAYRYTNGHFYSHPDPKGHVNANHTPYDHAFFYSYSATRYTYTPEHAN